MNDVNYAAPQTLEEAISLLASAKGARPLAGGHTLLVEPGRSQLSGVTLVDLGRIPELVGATNGNGSGGLTLGAMTTIATLAADPTLQASYPALAEAANLVGDPQVRNRATLGGSLAACDAASDLPPALLAHDALIHLRSAGGKRAVSTSGFITGFGETALTHGEIITAVQLPAPAPRTGSAYEKIKHPATLYALCGVAASVTLADDGTVSACRLGLTGATRHATRLSQAEAALVGQAPTDEAIAVAAQAATHGLAFRNDRFGSNDYRAQLTRVLTQRALTRAAARARG